MISRRYAPLVFAFLLAGLMSLPVSGITTYRTAAVSVGIVDLWISAWLTACLIACLIAFPAVLVTAPLMKWIADRVTVEKEAY